MVVASRWLEAEDGLAVVPDHQGRGPPHCRLTRASSNDQPPPLQIEKQVLINQHPADLWQPMAAPAGKASWKFTTRPLSLTALKNRVFKYR